MKIIMQMGREFDSVRDELASLGRDIEKAASAGLATGGKIAAGKVVRDYLSGQRLGLKRRSGGLARELGSWMAAPNEVVVGIPDGSTVDRYKWLLGDEQMTIKPKGVSRFLAIPIGENLTGTGVPTYSSPYDVDDGYFIKSKGGQLLFGRKNGKRGKFRPLFVLVTSVFVQGTGALYDGVMESLDDIADAIEDSIGKIKDVN